MTPLIVPPVLDCTVDYGVDPIGNTIDLGARFLSRAVASVATGDGVPSSTPFRSAAARILARPARDRAYLRALGIAVRELAADDPALRVAIDDVEIVGGTTERSRDVADAVADSSLFAPEVEHAVQCCPAGPVRVLVETDQQLPAALAVAIRMGPARVQLCGTFADTHRRTLLAMPELRGAGWSPSGVSRRRIHPRWCPNGQSLDWLPDPAAWRPGRPWAAWWDAEVVATTPAAALTECHGLVVTAARISSPGQVTGVRGNTVDLTAVLAGPSGVAGPRSIELLVGAPGVGRTETERSARELATGKDGIALAGLRPFGLPVDASDAWGVNRKADPGRDLPRWALVDGPGIMPAAERADLIRDLLGELAPSTGLFPGRFAASAVVPEPVPGGWDASAVVVDDDPVGLDGSGAGGLVVNLRSGTAFRLHPRLAPVVARLSRGEHTVLERLGDRTRDRLADQLARVGAWQDAR